MLQKEFEQRIGKEVDKDYFEHINDVYMATNLDKDAFCDSWKGDRRRIIDNLRNELINSQAILQDQKETMIRCAHQAIDHGVTSIAINLIGYKECILYKAKKGIQLTDDELNYLFNELK